VRLKLDDHATVGVGSGSAGLHLSNPRIRRLIKRARTSAGIYADVAKALSDHSMRVGAAQDMASKAWRQIWTRMCNRYASDIRKAGLERDYYGFDEWSETRINTILEVFPIDARMSAIAPPLLITLRSSRVATAAYEQAQVARELTPSAAGRRH